MRVFYLFFIRPCFLRQVLFAEYGNTSTAMVFFFFSAFARENDVNLSPGSSTTSASTVLKGRPYHSIACGLPATDE